MIFAAGLFVGIVIGASAVIALLLAFKPPRRRHRHIH